jgi:hypothetical protein
MVYELNKNGFQVFKNVFTEDEINIFREKIIDNFLKRLRENNLLRHFKSPHVDFESTKCDLIGTELEEFDYIILNQKILSCVKELLGENAVYFMDSNVQYGKGFSGYHKDLDISKANANHKDWKSNYDVVRMGMYFQDTKNYSGGLLVKDKSQNHINLSKGKAINLPLETGDIVFWKLTTTHSGNASRLKFFPNLALPGRMQRMIPEWTFIPEQKKRLALFCTFGREGHHLSNFIEYCNLGTKTSQHFRNSNFTKRSYEISAESKIKLINPTDLNSA